ncbi:MAG: YgcG family protein [Lysobacter sp.]|nr:YgcG family protein [Lysobacter sp.]
MTRAFAALLSAGLLMLALAVFAQSLAPIPPLTSPVVDTTGTLNAGQIAQLEQQALALRQRKGSQLQILIVPTTQPEAIEQYAQRVFDEWKLGRSNVDDGVLLLVAKDDREVRIQPGYGLEGAIPDITAGRVIQEYLVPKFRAGDFAGGIGDASAQLVRLIEGEALPAPMAPLTGEGGGLSDGFGAMFFAFIVAIFSRNLFGTLSLPLRMLLGGAASGAAAFLYSAPWWLVLVAALGGMVIGSIASMGRYVKHGGWGDLGASGPSGGGSWPSSSGSSSGSSWPSSSSSSGSSGWSGGGGRSGGGGASGRW